eukprot:CAMPEP_0172204936 /NCGR_PEP_ID=MMETSP1050-20130122/32291_1 /TAXON_ID=233186 /ORGANISM="Cryptomonas curvata, Strain CCAP979/52" /LENGTH=195 /DNA_ID=CAMNT_0012883667 /DNA_START=302 /DNA_END=886 /DNA_ORIENTATION=-
MVPIFRAADACREAADPTITQPVSAIEESDIWMFEQPIGFLNITVNIRMTVIKLRDGSLLVHDPIAPTGECLRQLRALGDVRHIVLGTTALEHKFFCRAFADSFPDASLYVCPGVFNYAPPLPANLPCVLNGVEYPESPRPAWADEFDHALLFLGTPIANAAEAALYHSPSRTLLVTDAVVRIASDRSDWLTAAG